MPASTIVPIAVPESCDFIGQLKGLNIPVASARFLEQLTTEMAGRFG